MTAKGSTGSYSTRIGAELIAMIPARNPANVTLTRMALVMGMIGCCSIRIGVEKIARFALNSDLNQLKRQGGGSAFLKVQISPAKTNYLEPSYSADYVNISEYINSENSLEKGTYFCNFL